MFTDRPDSYWVLSMDAVFLGLPPCLPLQHHVQKSSNGPDTRPWGISVLSSGIVLEMVRKSPHKQKPHFRHPQSLSDWSTARMTTKRKTHPYSRATSVGTEREREASLTTGAVDDGMETRNKTSSLTAAEPLKTALDSIQTVFLRFSFLRSG